MVLLKLGTVVNMSIVHLYGPFQIYFDITIVPSTKTGILNFIEINSIIQTHDNTKYIIYM